MSGRMARRTDRHGGGGGHGGPSQRQLRVGELIRRALSETLARGDVHDPALSETSITVGEVRTSPDLKVATVHVLPLGGAGAEAALEALNRNRPELRRRVARAVALKFAPELRFRLDDTFDRLDAARRLFEQEAVRRDVEGEEEDASEEWPEALGDPAVAEAWDAGGPRERPEERASEAPAAGGAARPRE